jgi:hypothetical protein
MSLLGEMRKKILGMVWIRGEVWLGLLTIRVVGPELFSLLLKLFGWVKCGIKVSEGITSPHSVEVVRSYILSVIIGLSVGYTAVLSFRVWILYVIIREQWLINMDTIIIKICILASVGWFSFNCRYVYFRKLFRKEAFLGLQIEGELREDREVTWIAKIYAAWTWKRAMWEIFFFRHLAFWGWIFLLYYSFSSVSVTEPKEMYTLFEPVVETGAATGGGDRSISFVNH